MNEQISKTLKLLFKQYNKLVKEGEIINLVTLREEIEQWGKMEGTYKN